VQFAPLPIAASRMVATIGFPDSGLQGFAPKAPAHDHHGGNRCWEVELRPGEVLCIWRISRLINPFQAKVLVLVH